MCFTLKHDQVILQGNALFRETNCGQHHNTHTLRAVKDANNSSRVEGLFLVMLCRREHWFANVWASKTSGATTTPTSNINPYNNHKER